MRKSLEYYCQMNSTRDGQWRRHRRYSSQRQRHRMVSQTLGTGSESFLPLHLYIQDIGAANHERRCSPCLVRPKDCCCYWWQSPLVRLTVRGRLLDVCPEYCSKEKQSIQSISLDFYCTFLCHRRFHLRHVANLKFGTPTTTRTREWTKRGETQKSTSTSE